MDPAEGCVGGGALGDGAAEGDAEDVGVGLGVGVGESSVRTGAVGSTGVNRWVR